VKAEGLDAELQMAWWVMSVSDA